MIKISVKTQDRNRGGAMVLILREDNKVMVLKRPDWVSWAPGKWGLPGGAIEKGETPEDAAIRETKEETSLDVTNLQDIKLDLARDVYPFYTRSFSGEVEIDHEHDDWVWVDRSKIEDYDLTPQLIAMYDWVLNHG